MNAVAPIPGTECLAFPVYSDVPKGHKLEPVRDGMHAPHLRPGEWAIINPADREIVFGEIYQVEYSNGHKVIWQVRPERDTDREARRKHTGEDVACAYLRPLNNPPWPEVERRLRTGEPIYLSDGPITLTGLQRIIVGRVIGVYTAIPLDVLLKDPGGKLFIT